MRFCVLISLLFLTSCGFQPIYGDFSRNPETASALNNVYLDNIIDREGQELRNHMIDRMYVDGRPQQPTTHLEIKLKHSTADLGLQKDSTTTRQEYTLNATFYLRDMNDRVLTSGEARSIVSYSKLEAQYATVASRDDAMKRATTEVGEQIVNRISLYFAEKKSQKQEPALSPVSKEVPSKKTSTP